MISWYYVKGSERVGPVAQEDLENLVGLGELDVESYVWRKGFDNWEKLGSVEDLAYIFSSVADVSVSSEHDTQALGEDDNFEAAHLDYSPGEIRWEDLNDVDRVFLVKIGIDRGCEEAEYGPYNMRELQRAFREKRINQKTLIFVPGMTGWEFLGDLPIYQELTPLPPKIEDEDRRRNTRKPFVARLLFHDEEVVYEGVCRDVSIGGVQVLVSDFPGNVGDEITMNVHPDNSKYGFVARGRVVRLLEGNNGFSLRFVDMGPEAQKAIAEYVKKN